MKVIPRVRLESRLLRRSVAVVCLAVLGVVMVASGALAANTYDWTDWTVATTGLSGTVTGTIGDVTVVYTGEMNPAAQVSGGINYWIPSTPYVNSVVANAPSTPDIVRLSGTTAVKQITFSEPVKDPVMAIVSLGRPTLMVQYTFDAPFDVLSYGPGYFSPIGTPGTLTEYPGNILRGWEGHGTIQFQGTFTSISWTVTPSEYWHGFTIGLLSPITARIDIKPGSYPNSINIDSNGNGVVPVAILGSATFDVHTVDPLSVTLEGAAVRLKGKSGTAGSYEDVNGDGYDDLVVHIADFTVGEGATIANLTAMTYSGQPVEGSDSIRLVPPTQ